VQQVPEGRQAPGRNAEAPRPFIAALADYGSPMEDEYETAAPGWRVMVAIDRGDEQPKIVIEVWAAAISDSREAIQRVLAASGSDAATISALDQEEITNLRLRPGDVQMVLDDAWAAVLTPRRKRH